MINQRWAANILQTMRHVALTGRVLMGTPPFSAAGWHAASARNADHAPCCIKETRPTSDAQQTSRGRGGLLSGVRRHAAHSRQRAHDTAQQQTNHQLVLSTELIGASTGTIVQTDVHGEGTHLGLRLEDLQHQTQPSAEWAARRTRTASRGMCVCVRHAPVPPRCARHSSTCTSALSLAAAPRDVL
jgi:hypothetical protein